MLGVDGVVSPMDLPSAGYLDSIRSLIPEPHVITPFLLGVVYTSKESQDLNHKCAMLVGVDVYGDALIIPSGHKGRYLYNLLRYEFCSVWKTPLSSDAFSGFGRDNFAAHNQEVVEASLHLKVKKKNPREIVVVSNLKAFVLFFFFLSPLSCQVSFSCWTVERFLG